MEEEKCRGNGGVVVETCKLEVVGDICICRVSLVVMVVVTCVPMVVAEICTCRAFLVVVM